ncbi:MAG: sensor histidine kinase [Acidobacteriota bacterium]
MKLWSTRSISGRLTALILLVSGTALLLAYLSFLAYDFYSLRRNLIESLQAEASIIGMNTESSLIFDDPDTAESTLGALRGAPAVLAAEIFTPDGKPFARYTRPGSPDRAITPKLADGAVSGSWMQDGTVLLGHAIVSSGKPVGSVYMLAETRDVVHRTRQFGVLSAGILALCFGIALLATATMRGFIIRPLENLAAVARLVSRKKDYSVRAEIPQRRDEIAFLVRSFNEMLDEVEKSRTVLETKVAERTAELSAANRELEAFAYTVAHDLRGPLQEISNIGYLLQTVGAATQTPDQTIFLDKIVTATQKMSSLIDDLLNLSRATSMEIQRVPVNLSLLAKSYLAKLSEGSARHFDFVVAEGCVALADEGLISVMLENLLRNAWKYTGQRDPARIEFGSRQQKGETIFFVRDNGAGFDPTYADRLFRPFQRLHSQAEFPGTGVGLATVQRILARHGGRVWATGRIDQGAEFCFTIPAENGKSAA